MSLPPYIEAREVIRKDLKLRGGTERAKIQRGIRMLTSVGCVAKVGGRLMVRMKLVREELPDLYEAIYDRLA
jgi:hypothetical protein